MTLKVDPLKFAPNSLKVVRSKFVQKSIESHLKVAQICPKFSSNSLEFFSSRVAQIWVGIPSKFPQNSNKSRSKFSFWISLKILPKVISNFRFESHSKVAQNLLKNPSKSPFQFVWKKFFRKIIFRPQKKLFFWPFLESKKR